MNPNSETCQYCNLPTSPMQPHLCLEYPNSETASEQIDKIDFMITTQVCKDIPGYLENTVIVDMRLKLEKKAKANIKALIKQEKLDLLNRVEEALGEDETGKKDTPEGELYYPTRNGLRAELRHRISDMRDKL